MCGCTAFVDYESGITYLMSFVGTKPYKEDIRPRHFLQAGEVINRQFIIDDAPLRHGNTYYVTVMAHNGVGLGTLVSVPITIDASAPLIAPVNDGECVLPGASPFAPYDLTGSLCGRPGRGH